MQSAVAVPGVLKMLACLKSGFAETLPALAEDSRKKEKIRSRFRLRHFFVTVTGFFADQALHFSFYSGIDRPNGCFKGVHRCLLPGDGHGVADSVEYG
jgi:hypothetical protein